MSPDELPEALRRFATRALGDAPPHRRVLLEQRGEMRLTPDGRWMRMSAEQWMATDEVAFCWHARVCMAPLVTAVVEDAFEEGHGRLDAKVWGALPVAHAEGPSVDRGEAQRYLAELAWNPRALLVNRALRFAESPNGYVRVWTGTPATYVDLVCDEAGDIVLVSAANRPRGDEGPTPWEGRFEDYRTLGGLRVPARGEVTWLLRDGRFAYWRGEITALALE